MIPVVEEKGKNSWHQEGRKFVLLVSSNPKI